METIKAFLDTLLGNYEPVTFTIGNETYIPSGMAGVDITYCVRAGVFVIVIWALLRILGGMLCRK